MATMMFSTIGQAVGGPLGAAVGAMVGSTVDRSIFGGRGKSANDLLVQRSAYGEAIPRLYGRTRQAGIVIWALPLARGGNKGGGRKAWATSFAVALSSRPILDVGRIWADGREIRDADGQFGLPVRMRVYHGDGRQEPDPAILAAEGMGQAPGYQRLAYVVFEELDLGPFGNRIPNLSFEVIADDLEPGEWLADLGALSGILVLPNGMDNGAVGYAASTVRWRQDTETLARLCGAEVRFSGGNACISATGRTITIPETEIGAIEPGGDAKPIRRAAAGERPASLTFGYADPERDYQAGRQSATRGRIGAALVSDAPVTTSASMARATADRLLRKAETSIATLEISLSWRWLDVTAGDILVLGERSERWRVVRRGIEGMLVRLELVREPHDIDIWQHGGDSGRALPAPVLPAPPSIISVFETPVPLRAGVSDSGLWVSATGEKGWRGAEMHWTVGDNPVFLGEIPSAVPGGILLEALAAGPATIWDEAASVVIRLDQPDESFEGREAEAILAGANLIRIGAELLQFRDCKPVGDGVVRLSGLLRGRYGTEYAIATQPPGTRVQGILPEQALFLPLGNDAIGRAVRILAAGAGDPPGGTEALHIYAGGGAAPLAPAHVQIRRTLSGDIRLSWIPRDRQWFEWSADTNSVDQLFRCRFRTSVVQDVVEKTRFIDGTDFTYSADDQQEDFGFIPDNISVELVSQGNGPENIRSAGWVEFLA